MRERAHDVVVADDDEGWRVDLAQARSDIPSLQESSLHLVSLDAEHGLRQHPVGKSYIVGMEVQRLYELPRTLEPFLVVFIGDERLELFGGRSLAPRVSLDLVLPVVEGGH